MIPLPTGVHQLHVEARRSKQQALSGVALNYVNVVKCQENVKQTTTASYIDVMVRLIFFSLHLLYLLISTF